MGIEPTCSAWKADILPLNYTRIQRLIIIASVKCFVKCFCQFSVPFVFQRKNLLKASDIFILFFGFCLYSTGIYVIIVIVSTAHSLSGIIYFYIGKEDSIMPDIKDVKKAAAETKPVEKKAAPAKKTVKKPAAKKPAVKKAPAAKKVVLSPLDELTTLIWKKLEKKDVSKISATVAIQINVSDVGTFYIAVNANEEFKKQVIQADYYLADGIVEISSAEVKKIAAGGYDFIKAAKSGALLYRGDLTKGIIVAELLK